MTGSKTIVGIRTAFVGILFAGTAALAATSTSASAAPAPTAAVAIAAAAPKTVSFSGTVHARGGLHVRSGPSSAAKMIGTLRNGQHVSIACQVTGQAVNHNAHWYLLSRGGWVSANYVTIRGAMPTACPASLPHR